MFSLGDITIGYLEVLRGHCSGHGAAALCDLLQPNILWVVELYSQASQLTRWADHDLRT